MKVKFSLSGLIFPQSFKTSGDSFRVSAPFLMSKPCAEYFLRVNKLEKGLWISLHSRSSKRKNISEIVILRINVNFFHLSSDKIKKDKFMNNDVTTPYLILKLMLRVLTLPNVQMLTSSSKCHIVHLSLQEPPHSTKLSAPGWTVLSACAQVLPSINTFVNSWDWIASTI